MKDRITPGPWFVTEDCDIAAGTPDHCTLVATLCDEPLDICRQNDWLDEMQADAHLIAAAPDMLAALHAVLADANIYSKEEVLDQVDAAIRKAEGR